MRSKNIVNSISCGLRHCGDRYVGETERRLQEHEYQARHGESETPWGKHYAEKHAKEPVKFESIRAIASVPDTVERKIRESVEIVREEPSVNIY